MAWYEGGFDQFIDELQKQFIFNIRAEPTLMDKLRNVDQKQSARCRTKRPTIAEIRLRGGLIA